MRKLILIVEVHQKVNGHAFIFYSLESARWNRAQICKHGQRNIAESFL